VIPSSCTGVTNCGFETGTNANLRDSSTSDSKCAITRDPSFVHSGTYADQCTFSATSKFSFTYIDGSSNNGTTYVPGNGYSLSFWAKFSSGASDSGLTCTITPDNGDTASYQGSCQRTAAEQQNGFYQYALPFNATTKSMGFYININTVSGTYTFDDISVLLVRESPDPTPTPAPEPPVDDNCDGFKNCGFETGDFTGWDMSADEPATVSITNVAHTGDYAASITIPPNSARLAALVHQDITAQDVLVGHTYQFSFWAKLSSESDIKCSVNKFGLTIFDDVMPIVVADPGEFQQYAVAFTVPDQHDPDQNKAEGVFQCLLFDPITYIFDDFALVELTGSTVSAKRK
jgi:hypothetical protein